MNAFDHPRPGTAAAPLPWTLGRRLRSLRRQALPFVLILPAVILVTGLQVYPTLAGIWYAFHDVHLARLDQMRFVGLRNFLSVFAGPFPNLLNPVAGVTAIWIVGSVILQVTTGLGLALLLQQRWVRGRDLFRGLFLFPWVISGIVVGYSWRFVFDPTVGLLNTMLSAVGIAPRPWLVSAPLAIGALLLASTWRNAGYSLVLQMGGLQSISDEVYEAAAIDGVTGAGLLTRIILPLIKPFILVNLMTTSIEALNTFDIVLALTRGGPLFRTEIVSLYMYHQGFQWGFLGKAAAASLVVFLFSVVMIIAYVRLLHEEEAF
jgi:ABC-type sugar transport system permease subunit